MDGREEGLPPRLYVRSLAFFAVLHFTVISLAVFMKGLVRDAHELPVDPGDTGGEPSHLGMKSLL
jgi:hypothetical protein